MSLREKLHEIIFESDTFAGKAFDVTLFFLILSSVIIIMLDSVESVRNYCGPIFLAAEWIFTILFTIEFILRLMALKKPLSYVKSFYGIVDILSILPTYLSFFIAGIQFLLIIRVLRLIRMFRVFKMTHFLGEGEFLLESVRRSKRKIAVFLVTITTIVVVIGSFMYVLEGPKYGFTSIPKSIYWAVVTLTTVGYGDMIPHTIIGQIFSVVIMILGFGIIAIPTGIISIEMFKNRKTSNQSCRYCGREGHLENAKYCFRCGKKLNREKK